MRVGRVLAFSSLLLSAAAWGKPHHAAAPPPPPSSPAPSQDAPPPPSPEQQFHWQAGPRQLDIGHDIEIALPAHYLWLPMPEADRLMQKLGNFANRTLVGVIVGDGADDRWLISVRYTEDGHVDDSEKIDAGELLKAIQEGTEEANKTRQEHGFPPAHIDSWTQSPKYERDVHHLVWALTMKTSDGDSLNFNTRVLGRRGVVALNLVTPPERLEADRPHAATLLAATAFAKGARYEDFDKKTDKVAEFGLMGLILGGGALGAAKLVKVGLLAKFGKGLLALLIAGKKALVALFVLIGAGIKKLFGIKPKAKEPVAGAAPPPSSSTPRSSNDDLPPTGTDGSPPA